MSPFKKTGSKIKLTGLGNLMTRLLMLFFGLVLLVPCAYKLYAYGIFRDQAIAVSGVIDKPARGLEMGSRPFVEYEDLQGNVYYIKSKAKTHWFYAPVKGEKIRLFYLEKDPGAATVDSLFYYVLLPMGFMAVGGAIVVQVFKQKWRQTAKL
ncbi:MAG: hypothetical protein DRH26_18990 [Deltaproteobacteria bacterium]|nr:MAG: hypothetical protein DRH26_18990 [Deltaproteobacteria bacterium]